MRLKFFILSLLLFTVYSCKDKNPQADCGCESPAVKVHENVNASYLGNNSLLLRHIVGGDMLMEESYTLCTYADTLAITPDIRNPDYIVSGIERKKCFEGPTLTIQAQHFEITKIAKIQ